jgi:error-prone DNA polymerase
VRMGLRYVRGLGKGHWEKISRARGPGAFVSEDDVVQRTGLDIGAMKALAESGALDSLGHNRRQALWAVHGPIGRPDPLSFNGSEPLPAFRDLTVGEEVAWDYRNTAHSPRGHPLQACREALRGQGLPEARAVAALPHGRRVRYAGLVICRQSPATASGVTFMTLEDETGFVNVVLWKRIFDAFPALAKAARFLGVTGWVESQSGVVHIVAESLWKPAAIPQFPAPRSRDFR